MYFTTKKMSRLLTFAVYAPSVLEFFICLYAAFLTRQFYSLWVFLLLFIAAKLYLKRHYLREEHEKID